MAVVLFDNDKRSSLYPFTYTKAVAGLFYGMMSVQNRWQLLMQSEVLIETVPYLQALYGDVPDDIHTWINAALLPDDSLIDHIKKLKEGDVLEDGSGIIACCGKGTHLKKTLENSAINFLVITDVHWLRYPHQLLQINDAFIRSDFALLTNGKTSQPIPSSNHCTIPGNIFIEEGAYIECAVINAQSGPVYIGKNAVVMEGSLLRGPLFIGEGAVVKMGAKIYGATSIGHHGTAGGEIKNSILSSYSNKAHDGYLGDSVVGEWCNFGAGASNSNVKNTAGDVMLWNDYENSSINAGNKCGVMVGDYTRIAINSSINTGSVYGISCNVFGEGLLPARLRNFCWGATGEGYTIDKAIKHIRHWKAFKAQTLSPAEESALTYIFDHFINP